MIFRIERNAIEQTTSPSSLAAVPGLFGRVDESLLISDGLVDTSPSSSYERTKTIFSKKRY